MDWKQTWPHVRLSQTFSRRLTEHHWVVRLLSTCGLFSLTHRSLCNHLQRFRFSLLSCLSPPPAPPLCTDACNKNDISWVHQRCCQTFHSAQLLRCYSAAPTDPGTYYQPGKLRRSVPWPDIRTNSQPTCTMRSHLFGNVNTSSRVFTSPFGENHVCDQEKDPPQGPDPAQQSSTEKQVNDFTFPEKFLYLSHCSLDCFIRHSSEHVLIYSVNKIVIYNELLLMCESHWWNI